MKRKLYTIIILTILFSIFNISIVKADNINIDSLRNNVSIRWNQLEQSGTSLQAGYYELQNDYYFDKQIVANLDKNETIYIDLNGHKLTYGGWANWETEETPANYQGTVNAAIYGGAGNIYIFDSSKNNSINIDFSLVEGFDNITLKNIKYNASAWRTLIITNGKLEIYDSTINDINHCGVASLNAGEIIIENSILNITSLYTKTLLNITNAQIQFYSDSDYVMRYNSHITANIINSDIKTNSMNIFGVNNSFNSSLKISNSSIRHNNPSIGETISILATTIEIDSSTIDLVKLQMHTKLDIINSDMNFYAEKDYIIRGLSNNTTNIIDTKIDFHSVLFYGTINTNITSDLNISNSKIISSNTTIGDTLSIITGSFNIKDSELKNICRINVKKSDTENYITNSDLILFSSSAATIEGLMSRNMNLTITDSNMKVSGQQLTSNIDTITINNSKINSAEGNNFNSYAMFMSGKNISINSSIIHSTGILALGAFKKIDIKNSDLYYGCNNAILLTTGSAEIVVEDSKLHTDLVARSADDIKAQKLTFKNVDYRGSALYVNGDTTIEDSKLDLYTSGGEVLINVSGNFNAKNSEIYRNEISTNRNSMFMIRGNFNLDNVKIKSREYNTTEVTNEPEAYISGDATLNKVDYVGGILQFHKGLTLKDSNLEFFQDGSSIALTVYRKLTMEGSTLKRLEGSSGKNIDLISVSQELEATDSSIIIENIEEIVANLEENRASIIASNINFNNVKYTAGRLKAAAKDGVDISISNSELNINTKDEAAFEVNGDSFPKDVLINNTKINFSSQNKDITLFTDGTYTLSNIELQTNTNTALQGVFSLDGDISINSNGDFDIYLNDLGNITLGENIKLLNEISIFNSEIEQDNNIPVFKINYETTYKEINKKLQNFTNPYHGDYRLRYNTNDQSMYWTSAKKVNFIDREEKETIYFFKEDLVNMEDRPTQQVAGVTYEFLGWYLNEEGTGNKFITGTTPDEDNLTYYAVWNVIEEKQDEGIVNPPTGATVLFVMIALLILYFIVNLFNKNNKKIFNIK